MREEFCGPKLLLKRWVIIGYMVSPPYKNTGMKEKLVETVYSCEPFKSNQRIIEISTRNQSEVFTNTHVAVVAKICRTLPSFQTNLQNGLTGEMVKEAKEKIIDGLQTIAAFELLRFLAMDENNIDEYEKFKTAAMHRLYMSINALKSDLGRLVSGHDRSTLFSTTIPEDRYGEVEAEFEVENN